jgi:hypothetical protein
MSSSAHGNEDDASLERAFCIAYSKPASIRTTSFISHDESSSSSSSSAPQAVNIVRRVRDLDEGKILNYEQCYHSSSSSASSSSSYIPSFHHPREVSGDEVSARIVNAATGRQAVLKKAPSSSESTTQKCVLEVFDAGSFSGHKKIALSTAASNVSSNISSSSSSSDDDGDNYSIGKVVTEGTNFGSFAFSRDGNQIVFSASIDESKSHVGFLDASVTAGGGSTKKRQGGQFEVGAGVLDDWGEKNEDVASK